MTAPVTTPAAAAVTAPRLFPSGEIARLGRARHAAALVRYAVLPILALVPPLRSLRQALRAWRTRLNDCHFLASLSEFQVHEMGLTLAEREHEIHKPFWEA